jgi:hypothetical protein
MLSAGRRSERICGVEIVGNFAFRRQASDALALLEPLAAFSLIRSHLAVIRQGRRSGVTAWAADPVFTVGAPTWSHSVHWFAGAMAHDAFHVKLYRDAQQSAGKQPDVDSWSGKTAEQACLLFQLAVLVSLRSDKFIIEHVGKHLENPTYQGRMTRVGAWLDYRKRWW